MSEPIKLVETYSLHSSKDKIITRTVKKYFDLSVEVDVCLAVLVVVIRDFNPDLNIDYILSDTNSFQIRPKALYKSSRGIFYKDEKERRYLSTQEIIDLKIENKELGKYLI